ncbi:MAG: efflux RND transporter periplasmic adaptor subunit [Pseudomonadota bacterium]
MIKESIATLVAAACGTLLLAEGAKAQDDETPRVPITVSDVRAEAMAPGIPATGTVFSRGAAQITAGLDAQLVWVAEPGDFVKAGEPVARFDCRGLELRRDELAALVEREKVRVRSLSDELGRMEQASLATSVNQMERVRADRDLARIEAQVGRVRVSQVEREIGRCTAPAPFAGVVIEQEHRGGEDVTRGTVLAAMTDTRHLEVRSSVPIRHLPRTRIGVDATIRLGETVLSGRVRTVVPAANAASQTFEVRIDLPEEAPALMAAGQLVEVTLPLAANAAITVPRDSIVLRSDGAFVLRISAENTAQLVAVELREASGERVSIRGDLEPGDRVAVRGAEALDDGEAVTIFSEG